MSASSISISASPFASFAAAARKASSCREAPSVLALDFPASTPDGSEPLAVVAGPLPPPLFGADSLALDASQY